MAAANAYRAKTLSFASSAKLGLQSLKLSHSGQTTDLVTDAVDSVTAIFVDSLVTTLQAVVSAFDGVNTIKPGDTGALVIVFEKRAEGRAAAGSGNLTATMATAVVESVECDGAVTGTGTASISFRCSAPSGGGAIAWT